MVRQSSLSYFCGRNRNTLAPYREIFINFYLFPLLFPYLFLSSDSVQGDALPDLLLQIGSFPLSPFLSSQGERGKWFRHRLWLVMSGVVVVAAGSYGSNLLKGLNHTQRRVVYL